ncbi:TRAP transporter small permease [Chachezhania antarctica]|uniref:TRAP transporter small permease n=1 Tax=Chachezhania antarctica TaxID=2340860 RepID=UPI000EAC0CC8|nr:TRAP transporter small permease [Chachezhania antarctica]|tara:strand:- start:261 stop:782 length:522 start_codon:yes stop_codon:yes gene_type:complete
MTRRGQLLGRIEARIVALVRRVLGLGLIAMVLLNVANAAGRYGGLPTLTGADEALVYGMIWIVMLGAILAARSRDHLTIDLLPDHLGTHAAAFVRMLTDAATLAVCAFVAWHSWSFVERIGAIGQTSMGLGIPMVIPHFAITLGFAGMALMAAVLLVADLAALRQPAPRGERA